MRIFLSYASEDHASAEMVKESLAARGHDVFFDRDAGNLPAGATFEDKIEQAIAQAEAFVFLISQHSITSGCFALTELSIAQQKWPSADGRVLPVMLGEIDLASVPAYLKSVTILQPAGNVPAEVALSVNAMRRQKPARIVGLTMVAGIVAGAAIVYSFWPAPDLVINIRDPVRHARGFFEAPDLYKLSFEVENRGSRAGTVVSVQVQTEPSATVDIVSQDISYTAQAPTVIASGDVLKNHYIVSLTEASRRQLLWKVCVTRGTGEKECSEPREWMPQGSFVPVDAFQVDPEASARAVLLAATHDGFFIATRNPNRLLHVGMDGSIQRKVNLEGEPTALFARGDDLLVGTRGPDAIVRLDPISLRTSERSHIRFPSQILGAFDAPVSSTPASIGKADGRIWIVTRGAAAAAGLIHFSETLSDPIVPAWFEQIAYNLDSLHLSSDGNVVWGAVTNVTPASLYRLSRDKLRVFSGHDWDIASCATDILAIEKAILVPDCTGTIQRVKVAKEKLAIESQIGPAFGYDSSRSIWTELHLRQDMDGRVAAFVVNQDRDREMAFSRSVTTRLDPKQGSNLVLEVGEARIVDLAIRDSILMVILENNQGRRETLAIASDL